MIPTLKHKDVHTWFNDILTTDLKPLLLGGVGKGKTKLAYAYAEKKELKPVTIYLDSMYEMDVIGYAVPNQEKGKFEYLPCGLFPLENDPIPVNPKTMKPYKGFLIIFDEFGNCPKSMQVAAQRVINEGSIGSHKLHPKCKIVLLGNKVSSGANALPLSSAVRSRCAIAELETNSLDNIELFRKYTVENGWHPTVSQWIADNRDDLKQDEQHLIDDGESPFNTWRGMESVSILMHKLQTHSAKASIPLKDLVQARENTFRSMMGYEKGQSFVNSVTMTNSMAGYDEILTSPDSAQLPSNTMDTLKIVNYLIGSVASEYEAKQVVRYVNRISGELRETVKVKLKGANVFIDDAFDNEASNGVPV